MSFELWIPPGRMKQENACRVRGKSGRSFGLEPDCRVKSRSWRTDKSVGKRTWRQPHHDKNLQYVSNYVTNNSEFLQCPAEGSILPEFEFFFFFRRLGTVFSQFMHTTHPFCKAVGSYASVIPPWENNTQDSEPVRSCKHQRDLY